MQTAIDSTCYPDIVTAHPVEAIVLPRRLERSFLYYIDVIMTTMASQITILTIVYSTVYSDAD